MEQTDEELLRAYNSGDSKAFEQLFARHKSGVFNFALRLGGSRADAEDVTSEVFLALSQGRYKDDGRAKLTTWLLTVARNSTLTRLRSGSRTLSLWFKGQKDEEEQWDIPDSRDSHVEELSQREEALKVKRAIAKLPVEMKEALVLREYSGKNYAEIAEILQCSVDKVKVLIFRAREKLRTELLETIKGEE